jgi:hypothetical protein
MLACGLSFFPEDDFWLKVMPPPLPPIKVQQSFEAEVFEEFPIKL